jgi:hypothetical protein
LGFVTIPNRPESNKIKRFMGIGGDLINGLHL